jgi:RNase adaptor protein for sRNA GlmZ degradation
VTRQLVHATCVALDGAEGTRGVLIRGPSGAGKSDLALRMIDAGARLVADDQCEIWREEGTGRPRLMASAPETIAGALEVRGLGIVQVPTVAEAPLALLVDLVPPDDVERLPEEEREEMLGLDLPRVALHAFEAAAPAKLRLALGTRAPGAGSPMARGAKQPIKAGPAGTTSRRVVLVTGLSGAGRSTALKILEDLGYEAIDNLPLEFLSTMAGEGAALAIGVDIRTRDFAVQPFLEQLDLLGAKTGLAVTLLFLDCEDRVLERRFTETRRRHPLAQDRRVADGIAAERRLVAPLRERAELTIDTSALNPGELRRLLSGQLELAAAPGMAVFVTSFAYRNGLPREADLVFDVRFLANPHYEEDLRDLDGRDGAVAAFVKADPSFAAFFDGLTALLTPLLPRYEEEGKSYLTIAVGCTGGQHRSVAVAEKLADWLAARGRRVQRGHRDLTSV